MADTVLENTDANIKSDHKTNNAATAKSDTSAAEKPSSEKLSAAAVKRYLAANPDFFDQHPDALGDLRLPALHNNQYIGALNTRQLSVLRQRKTESDEKLKDFLINANDNQRLIDQAQHFVLELLDCKTRQELLKTTLTLLAEEFEVEFPAAYLLNINEQSNRATDLLAFLDDSAQHAHCFAGALRENESLLFFEQKEIRSAVVMGKPIMNLIKDNATDELENNEQTLDSNRAENYFILGVGSSDCDFYCQDIGIDIVEFLGEVAAKTLARLPCSD